MMGRSYQNLLVLRPGMMIYPGGGGWTMSTNGSRPEENSFCSGRASPTTILCRASPSSTARASPVMPRPSCPSTRFEELNIQENPSAEYGGKNGAFVNVGIKSGTNGYHGTACAIPDATVPWTRGTISIRRRRPSGPSPWNNLEPPSAARF